MMGSATVLTGAMNRCLLPAHCLLRGIVWDAELDYRMTTRIDAGLLARAWMDSFKCSDTGFLNQTMLRSRVGDGICDCCDGSDESPIIGCPNTCEALRAEARENAIAHYKQTAQGLRRRHEMVDQALRELQARSKSTEELKKEHHALQQLLFKVKIRRHKEERVERQERYEYIQQAQYCSADETCSASEHNGGSSKGKSKPSFRRARAEAKATPGDALERVMSTVCQEVASAAEDTAIPLPGEGVQKETLKSYLTRQEAAGKQKRSQKNLYKTTLLHRLITEGGFKTILQYFFEAIGLVLTPLHFIAYGLRLAWQYISTNLLEGLRRCSTTCSPSLASYAQFILAEFTSEEPTVLRYLEYRRYSAVRTVVAAMKPIMEYAQWPFITAWNAPWVYYLLYL